MVGNQIATVVIQLWHKLKVLDDVKAGSVGGPRYEFKPSLSSLTMGDDISSGTRDTRTKPADRSQSGGQAAVPNQIRMYDLIGLHA